MANQGDFAAGQVLTAAELNAFRQVTVLEDTISVPNGTNTTASFSTELIDVGGWHSSGSPNIVVPYDGVYTITANVYSFASARGLVNISTPTDVLASTDVDPARDISCSVTRTLTASTNVSLVLFQASGVTQTPRVTFSMELVRRT